MIQIGTQYCKFSSSGAYDSSWEILEDAGQEWKARCLSHDEDHAEGTLIDKTTLEESLITGERIIQKDLYSIRVGTRYKTKNGNEWLIVNIMDSIIKIESIPMGVLQVLDRPDFLPSLWKSRFITFIPSKIRCNCHNVIT